MGLIKIIRSLLGKPNQTQNAAVNTSLQKYEDCVANHQAKIAVEAESFINKYGTDFFGFLYQSFTDHFIKLDVLPFRDPDSIHNTFLDNDHWKKKHPFNFPGPFYAGESDNCGTGPAEAPNNILQDAEGCEFIFKQPQSYTEFLCVLDAAAVEVFDSYSCNGNEYWTYQTCKDWWKNKDDLLNAFKNENNLQPYIDYLKGNAATDIRKYCYFLENGVYPNNTDKLPLL